MTYLTEAHGTLETSQEAGQAWCAFLPAAYPKHRETPTRHSNRLSKVSDLWKPERKHATGSSALPLAASRDNTDRALSTESRSFVIELTKWLAKSSELNRCIAETAAHDEIGPFEPSDQTVQLLGNLVNIAAEDAAKFANELDLTDTAYLSEPQRLRRSLVRAVHNSLALFARVSGEVGNGNADISASTGFRPVYADYLLAELPLIPKADAGRILLSIRRDLDRLCNTRNIKAGRATLSKRGDGLVVSLRGKAPARSASLLAPVNSVSFE